MIILDTSHHDLEVVYQYRYRAWRLANDGDVLRLSGQLATALHNLRAAGYTPAEIAKLGRAALEREVPRQRIDEFLTQGEE